MADDVHHYHNGSQSIARTNSQPHAGYSRRGRRGRLDEWARAQSDLAQAPSRAGPGRLSDGTASLAASEQRQERGPRAPGGSVVIWPIAGASGERNLKRRVADGLLHAPCRKWMEKLKHKQPAATSAIHKGP